MSAGTILHLVAGEYPPRAGGVGDYTALLAGAIARAGVEVHVWCPDAVPDHSSLVAVHRLPDRFGPETRRALGDALHSRPGTALLQYVPNTLGARGANLSFCRWLRQRGSSGGVRVMFHEPYFYFGWHPGRNGLAMMQRLMAYHLLRAAPMAYVSTETWRRYLHPYAPAGLQFVTLPIPATVPDCADPAAVAAWRQRLHGHGGGPLVVHFGTFGEHVAAELRAAIPALLDAHPTVRIACAGRGSEAFTAAYASTRRVTATGALEPPDVAAVLRACDLALQPYPDGVTTRRTTVMAALANGVPTLSSDGALTEPVWRDTGALALVPAGDAAALAAAGASLLRDPGALARLGEAGARTYRTHFALERTLERLGFGLHVPAGAS